MDWMYLFVGAFVFAVGWLVIQVISEYAIGHYEGRKSWSPLYPREKVRKWAYTKGHNRGLKRGR